MSRFIDLEKTKLVEDTHPEDEALPTDRPVALYIRQSTKTQVKKNLASKLQQDKQAKSLLVAMGYTDSEESILEVATDQGISGQKLPSKRGGLQTIYQWIDNGVIGAIAAYDASRLWRDKRGENSRNFLSKCADKHIFLILRDRVYRPWIPDDYNRLRDLFDDAGAYIAVIEKATEAKKLALDSGSLYGGHCIPVGFTIVGETSSKRYIIYEPHAEVVRRLFKRFQQLNGNLAKLWHEVHRGDFVFPPFALEKPPHLALHYAEGVGYRILTRAGIASILTNPAYIGQYVFHGVQLSREAHPAIVDMDTWLYAYERLATKHLDGTPNENRPQVERHSYKNERTALLESLIWSDSLPVYPLASKGTYAAKNSKSNPTGGNTTELVVPIEKVDKAFAGAMRHLLLALEERKERRGLEDEVYAELLKKEEKKSALTEELATIQKGIRRYTRLLEIATEDESASGMREAMKHLDELEVQQAETTRLLALEEQDEEGLQEVVSLLDIAFGKWDSLSFDEQKRFVHLLVERVNIREATPHILRIDVYLRPPFNYSLNGFLFRSHGSRPAWTEEEKETIKQLYPRADRLDVLKALPRRNWESIVQQAVCPRLTWKNTSGIHESLSFSDQVLMVNLGMERGQESVDWNISFIDWRKNEDEEGVPIWMKFLSYSKLEKSSLSAISAYITHNESEAAQYYG